MTLKSIPAAILRGGWQLLSEVARWWKLIFVSVVILLIFDYLAEFAPNQDCTAEAFYRPSDIVSPMPHLNPRGYEKFLQD